MIKLKSLSNEAAIKIMTMAEKTPGVVDNPPSVFKVYPEDFHISESVPYLLANLNNHKCILLDHDTYGDKVLLVVGNGRGEDIPEICKLFLTELYYSFEENLNLAIDKPYVRELAVDLITAIAINTSFDDTETEDSDIESSKSGIVRANGDFDGV